ncbi:hypothetical protein WJX73_006822 [Symbiochloris irregularis]|uniref:Uncharacterized protein n=1 Tax=Symbiochloris irregularis TaxID=706552 RepID=A0AAW1NXY7_9CHLO
MEISPEWLQIAGLLSAVILYFSPSYLASVISSYIEYKRLRRELLRERQVLLSERQCGLAGCNKDFAGAKRSTCADPGADAYSRRSISSDPAKTTGGKRLD